MTILTHDNYIASAKQTLDWFKTASITSVAAQPTTNFHLAGNPSAGTLAVGNTANGIVPNDALAGYLPINALSATGHLSGVSYNWSVPGWLFLYDCLFSAGAFAFNAATTLTTQPSYSARVPGGNYNGLEIWLEAVTAHTGNQSIRIQYLDEGGAAGDTGTIATGVAPILGRMYRMPMGSGDTGVQRIDVVTSTVSSAGTFNVHVMRPLWKGRVTVANGGDVHDYLKTRLKQVYGDSALRVVCQPDSTAVGLPSLLIELCDG